MILFENLTDIEQVLSRKYYQNIFSSGFQMDLSMAFQDDVFICKTKEDVFKTLDELLMELDGEVKNNFASFSHFEIRGKEIRVVGQRKKIQRILHPTQFAVQPNASTILAQKINEIIDYLNK